MPITIKTSFDLCTGCGLCNRYCPIEMIHLDPDLGKSVKCDPCDGKPACVEVCSTGALVCIAPAAEDESEGQGGEFA